MDLPPPPNPGPSHLDILRFITSAKIWFANEVTSHVPRVRTWGVASDLLQQALCLHVSPPTFSALLVLF